MNLFYIDVITDWNERAVNADNAGRERYQEPFL